MLETQHGMHFSTVLLIWNKSVACDFKLPTPDVRVTRCNGQIAGPRTQSRGCTNIDEHSPIPSDNTAALFNLHMQRQPTWGKNGKFV